MVDLYFENRNVKVLDLNFRSQYYIYIPAKVATIFKYILVNTMPSIINKFISNLLKNF